MTQPNMMAPPNTGVSSAIEGNFDPIDGLPTDIKNTWAFKYNQSTNTYNCTFGDEITKVNGTWKVNSENTMLSLEINGNTVFLHVEFDGEFLKFNSSEVFLNKNANGELKNIRGSVSYTR